MKKITIAIDGFSSCGKSTMAKALAKRIGYRFIDVDLMIQDTTGKLLKEIIAEQGMDGFMEVENRINASIRAERAKWEADLDTVYDILQAGTAKAQAVTNATLARVEKAMRIDYFADRCIVKEWEKQLKAAKL